MPRAAVHRTPLADAPGASAPQGWLDRTPDSRALCARGFTIIELLIVITIIVILASMGMVQYRNSVTRAREAVLKEDLFRMRDAIDQFHADQNKYPSTLENLVKEGYLREVPEDPITRSRETWVTVPAEPNANDTSVEPGIYDVKSGADQMSLDGSPYAEWE